MPPQTAEHKLVVQRVNELMTRRSADDSHQQEHKKLQRTSLKTIYAAAWRSTSASIVRRSIGVLTWMQQRALFKTLGLGLASFRPCNGSTTT